MKEAELKLKDIQIKIQMAAEDNNKKLLTELFIKEEAIKNEYDEQASIYKAAVNEALRNTNPIIEPTNCPLSILPMGSAM
mgnify:CR=1 FL=1